MDAVAVSVSEWGGAVGEGFFCTASFCIFGLSARGGGAMGVGVLFCSVLCWTGHWA